ncbi:hypothetical protein ACE38W_14375 [Chitinophaga sp. Hz27]|uniref:hypothetical protein n=1 Tax=Chitinophaga sp. Hz27 TaxID=3347169 RepID=UPI0035DD3D41
MIIKVEEGKGIIDVLHDGLVACLKIRKPIAICYSAFSPTCEYYYKAAGFDPYMAQQLDQLLIDGDDESILDTIPDFLRLFRTGEYAVEIVRPEGVNRDRHYATKANDLYYDFGDVWLYTQPEETLNPERIQYYETMIKNGGRPKVIVYSSSMGSYYWQHNFIIDGHHKTTAYRNCGIEPVYVRISMNFKAEEEFAAHKTLFLSYDFLLDDNDRKLITTHFPMVHCSDDLISAHYNHLMDDMLRTTTNVMAHYVEFFRKIYQQQAPSELRWLMARLRAILEGAIDRPVECFYTYREDPQGPNWRVRWPVAYVVSDNATFCEWIQLAFNTSWEEMNKAVNY